VSLPSFFPFIPVVFFYFQWIQPKWVMFKARKFQRLTRLIQKDLCQGILKSFQQFTRSTGIFSLRGYKTFQWYIIDFKNSSFLIWISTLKTHSRKSLLSQHFKCFTHMIGFYLNWSWQRRISLLFAFYFYIHIKG